MAALWMERFKKKYVLWILFILYLCFNIYLLCVHEMWRDEINVWLMGRDLSVLQLFQELKYQGHPCLWYLLVMPFAKLGFPCWIMGWLSLGIMAAACYIFLFHSAFHPVVKGFLIFSPLFTYYYSVIARGYCLVALFIILLAWQYENRFEKPVVYGVLLGLLAQADTIAVPIAGLISAVWGIEACVRDIKNKKFEQIKKVLSGIWIPFISAVIYLMTMAHVSDSPVFEVKDMGLYDTIQALKTYAIYIIERLTGANHLGVLLYCIAFVTIGVGLSVIRKNGYPLVVLLGTYLFQVLFSVIIYELNIWHFLTIGFVFIWFMWVLDIRITRIRSIDFFISCFLIILGISMFYMWTQDTTSGFMNAINGSYSDAQNTATFLIANIDSDEVIFETDIAYAAPIWGYAKEYTPHFVGSQKIVSYADWSEEQSRDCSIQDLENWMKMNFPEHNSYILIETLDSHLIDWCDEQNCELLYETEESSARHEDYKIYRMYVR